MEATVVMNAAHTIFLCKVLGLCLTVLMLGLLLNRKHFQDMVESLINTPSMHFPATLLPLIIGSLILVSHNDWGLSHAAILVSAFGAVCFVAGFVRAIFPDFWISRVRECHTSPKVPMVMMGILGLGIIFLYAGFFS